MNTEEEGREQEIERWIDDALGRYAKAEPREGLERRILANLVEARHERSRRVRRWMALAFSTAAILVVALVWRPHTRSTKSAQDHFRDLPRQRTMAERGEGKDSGREPGGSKSAAASMPDMNQAAAVGKVKLSRRIPVVSPGRDEPALAQFPAPYPLSEQEELLARYVQEFPRKAALVARAQSERVKEDESEMASPWPYPSSASEEKQR